MRTSPKSLDAPVLCYGSDPLLIETRRLILERGGFVTDTVSTPDQFRACLRSRQFDLIVLCHSLSEELREDALKHVSVKKALVLTAAKLIEVKPGPVSTLNALDGPVVLLQTLRTKLSENQLNDSREPQHEIRFV